MGVCVGARGFLGVSFEQNFTATPRPLHRQKNTTSIDSIETLWLSLEMSELLKLQPGGLSWGQTSQMRRARPHSRCWGLIRDWGLSFEQCFFRLVCPCYLSGLCP